MAALSVIAGACRSSASSAPLTQRVLRVPIDRRQLMVSGALLGMVLEHQYFSFACRCACASAINVQIIIIIIFFYYFLFKLWQQHYSLWFWCSYELLPRRESYQPGPRHWIIDLHDLSHTILQTLFYISSFLWSHSTKRGFIIYKMAALATSDVSATVWKDRTSQRLLPGPPRARSALGQTTSPGPL